MVNIDTKDPTGQKQEEKLWTVIGLFFFFPIIIFKSFVISKLYFWHIVPVWEGAPAIDLWRALGIATLFEIVRTRQKDYFRPYNYDHKVVLYKPIYYCLMLLLGWIAS